MGTWNNLWLDWRQAQSIGKLTTVAGICHLSYQWEAWIGNNNGRGDVNKKIWPTEMETGSTLGRLPWGCCPLSPLSTWDCFLALAQFHVFSFTPLQSFPCEFAGPSFVPAAPAHLLLPPTRDWARRRPGVDKSLIPGVGGSSLAPCPRMKEEMERGLEGRHGWCGRCSSGL